MSAQPMLESKEDVETTIAVPTAEAVVVSSSSSDAMKAKYETKATALRRAATALLIFSIMCSRPWPSIGWLGSFAAIPVLCASSTKLLCRARCARFLSAILAILAGYKIMTVAMSIRTGMPQRVADEVHNVCVTMPAETFQWGQAMVNEHHCARKAVSFLAHHASTDTPAVLVTADTLAIDSNATHLVGTEQWSQAAACATAARIVKFSAKMMAIGSVVAHLLLFLAAIAVVKRACCLRCMAYRCGLLDWKGCRGCKCKNDKPMAVMPGPKDLS